MGATLGSANRFTQFSNSLFALMDDFIDNATVSFAHFLCRSVFLVINFMIEK